MGGATACGGGGFWLQCYVGLYTLVRHLQLLHVVKLGSPKVKNVTSLRM